MPEPSRPVRVETAPDPGPLPLTPQLSPEELLSNRWWNEFDRQGTGLSREDFQLGEKWLYDFVGDDGQQNYRDLMKAKELSNSALTGVETTIIKIAESPMSMEACNNAINAVKNFVKRPEDEINSHLEATPSENGLIEAAGYASRNTLALKQALRLSLLSKLALAVKWDGLQAQWRLPKSESRKALVDYSEKKGRYLRQGLSVASLGVSWLLEQTDKHWEAFGRVNRMLRGIGCVTTATLVDSLPYSGESGDLVFLPS